MKAPEWVLAEVPAGARVRHVERPSMWAIVSPGLVALSLTLVGLMPTFVPVGGETVASCLEADATMSQEACEKSVQVDHMVAALLLVPTDSAASSIAMRFGTSAVLFVAAIWPWRAFLRAVGDAWGTVLVVTDEDVLLLTRFLDVRRRCVPRHSVACARVEQSILQRMVGVWTLNVRTRAQGRPDEDADPEKHFEVRGIRHPGAICHALHA